MTLCTLCVDYATVRFRGHVLSTGFVFSMVCALLTVVPPWLLAYSSDGLWLKSASVRHQPDVHFSHEAIVVLHHTAAGPQRYSVWSTYPGHTEALPAAARLLPVVTSCELDHDGDGRNDQLQLTAAFPAARRAQSVRQVDVLLTFRVQLYQPTRVLLQGVTFLQESTSVSASRLTVMADLSLHQRQLIDPRSHDLTQRSHGHHQRPVVDPISEDYDRYGIAAILLDYFSRNLTTTVRNKYSVWTPSVSDQSPFELRLTINYPVQEIHYLPGTWRVLKLAWVQYLSLLVVFAAGFGALKRWAFNNRLFPAFVDVSDGQRGKPM